MSERDPTLNPIPGDIVQSHYETIVERHVLHVSDCGVKYYRVVLGRDPRQGYCLPSIWTKWCRSHRVTIIQRGEVIGTSA